MLRRPGLRAQLHRALGWRGALAGGGASSLRAGCPERVWEEGFSPGGREPLPRPGLRWDALCKGRAAGWAFDVCYALAGPLRPPRQLQASLCLRMLKSRLGKRLPGGPQSRLGASCCLSLSSQAPFRGLQRSCSRKLSSTPSIVSSQGAALRERCPVRGPAGAGTAPPPRGALGRCGICLRPAVPRSLVAVVCEPGRWTSMVLPDVHRGAPSRTTWMRVASPVASLRFPLFSLLLMRHQLGPRGQRAPRLLWPQTGVASGKRCGLSALAGVEPWGQLLLEVLPGWGEGAV